MSVHYAESVDVHLSVTMGSEPLSQYILFQKKRKTWRLMV